jgi:hypothetical protein
MAPWQVPPLFYNRGDFFGGRFNVEFNLRLNRGSRQIKAERSAHVVLGESGTH